MTKGAVIQEVFLHGENADGRIRQIKVAGTEQISKGIMCVLVADQTASGAGISTHGGIFLGISSVEKDPTDTSKTTLGLWTDGLFDIECSGAVTRGAAVMVTDDNRVIELEDSASGAMLFDRAKIVGTAEEAGSDKEVINVRVNV